MSKVISIFGVILIIIGFIMAFVSFASSGFDERELIPNNFNFEEKSFTMDGDEIEKIFIDTLNEKITIYPTDDDYATITYYENKYYEYTVKSNNGVLSLEKDKRNRRMFNLKFLWDWWDYESGITISVPRDLIATLLLRTSNATVKVEDLSFTSADIKTSNNSIVLSDINISDELEAVTSNGNIDLKRVNSKDSINVTTSNNRIELNEVWTDNRLKVTTSNSSVYMDEIYGESIYIRTSNGSVKGSVIGSKEEYREDFSTSNGRANSENKYNNTDYHSQEREKNIEIRTSNAGIDITYLNE